MKIVKKISPAFEDFVFNWDYEQYLLIGGYGSGKSYDVAFKIVLKLLEEKRKVLVVRQVYDTIYESCCNGYSRCDGVYNWVRATAQGVQTGFLGVLQ